jgi:hypothetical protein
MAGIVERLTRVQDESGSGDNYEIIGDAIAEIESQAERLNEAGTKIAALVDAITRHRDQKGDDRCWLDDLVLYAAIGEPNAVQHLPEKCEFLKSCERYWEQRQAPLDKLVRAGDMTIGQLECEIANLIEQRDKLREACMVVIPESRSPKGSCWCPYYRDVSNHGHTRACQQMNEAIALCPAPPKAVENRKMTEQELYKNSRGCAESGT